MVSVLQKIFLVLWKNAIVRRRHWILTIIELVLPFLVFLFLGKNFPLTFNNVPPDSNPSQPITDLISSMYLRKIYYTPQTTFTESVMNSLNDSMNYQSNFHFPPEIESFDSESELLESYQTLNDSMTYGVYGIIFDVDKDSTTPTPPRNFRYKIRSSYDTDADTLFPPFGRDGPGYGYGSYLYSSISALQYLLDMAYLNFTKTTGKSTDFEFIYQRFPYPNYRNGFASILSMIIGILTVVSFIFMCPAILKRVVEEKATGVKELMKLMGYKEWMLQLSWFINAIVLNIVSCIFIVIFLKVRMTENSAVLENADGTVLWVFFVIYCTSTIFFLFAIGSFFSRPNIAMTAGIVLWLVSYYMIMPLDMVGTRMSYSTQLAICLLPNGALTRALHIILLYELRGNGIQWHNLGTPPSEFNEDISMGHVFGMLITNSIIYAIITWYMNNIMPGKYGIAKPWHFFITDLLPHSPKTEDCSRDTTSSKRFEKPSENLTPGIRIKDLKKVYGSLIKSRTKKAVDNVTIDFYSDKITALLGHNGAGKTTVMSILAGMFSPSSGYVEINGYDINRNLDKIRESLGLCPQHNMLFTDLTVREHLLFFGMLKGLSYSTAKLEADRMLEKIHLEDKKNKMSSALSGGMKRKLSLAIALIGPSKVLLLDEPTAGMDPEVRRQMWDLILTMRGQRTIIITTHFMEEADVLGDHIAIMDHGKVKCYGTSHFLKKVYGAGYHLSIMKNERCNPSAIAALIQQEVPDAVVKDIAGPVLMFTLPLEKTQNFPALFNVLEKDKVFLGINGIGISVTTLEEVFLRVGEEATENSETTSKENSNDFLNNFNINSVALTKSRNHGMKLYFQQFIALLLNRINFTYRKWIMLLMKILIPLIMTALTVTQSVSKDDSEVIPTITFSLDKYGATEVLYSVLDGEVSKLGQLYADEVSQTNSRAIKIQGDIITGILHVGEENIIKYRERLVIAAEFNYVNSTPVLNALFSTVAYHGPPISINMITNTLVRYYSESSEYKITPSYQMFPKLDSRKVPVVNPNLVPFLWFSMITSGLLSFTANFITFPLMERASQAKQLQYMAGVRPPLYWLTTFLWDFFQYLVMVALNLACIAIFDTLKVFSTAEHMGALFVIMFTYGLSAIPYTYLFSYFRNRNASAFALIILPTMLAGLIVPTAIFLLKISDDISSINNLTGIFRLIPHFSLSFAMMKSSQIAADKAACTMTDYRCKKHSYFASPFEDDLSILMEVIFMAIDCIIYFSIIFMIDYGLVEKLFSIIVQKIFNGPVLNKTLDADVVAEKSRINHQKQENITSRDLLIVDELTKKYFSFPAVRGVSFGVQSGECFGLLGTNGAGKTTTFQMLTGYLTPSSGNAMISKYYLDRNKLKFLSCIGYCPQFDAINEYLTGREMVEMYANLRGVSKKMVTAEVNRWIRLLGLTEYEARYCGTYSGGNKRKLSTVLALVGEPPVIFLDEPTSGVDPISRRNLWRVLSDINKTNQSIVLTSHSMEECEALCDRLAIMVEGQFVCMGNSQYLKQKFGQGFTIMMKLQVVGFASSELGKLKSNFQTKFNNQCVLKDEHQGLLHYHITNPNIPWAVLFATLEDLKATNSIVDDYTISETTLEQVFLSFARKTDISTNNNSIINNTRL